MTKNNILYSNVFLYIMFILYVDIWMVGCIPCLVVVLEISGDSWEGISVGSVKWIFNGDRT